MLFQPAALAFVAVSLPIAVLDLKWRTIPDVLSISGTGVVLLATAIATPELLSGRLLGAAVGLGAFLLIRYLTGGKLGMGDVKYSALIGAAVGVTGWFFAILCASVCGLAVTFVLMAFRKVGMRSRIPFAPFLAFGGVMSLLGADAFFRVLETGGGPW